MCDTSYVNIVFIMEKMLYHVYVSTRPQGCRILKKFNTFFMPGLPTVENYSSNERCVTEDQTKNFQSIRWKQKKNNRWSVSIRLVSFDFSD